jgi:uncharacterized paraquat-inducible protein A
MMGFKEWLMKETMTSTGCIAGFSRMTLPLVTRTWIPEIVMEKDPKKRKKVRPQPQVKESHKHSKKCHKCRYMFNLEGEPVSVCPVCGAKVVEPS